MKRRKVNRRISARHITGTVYLDDHWDFDEDGNSWAHYEGGWDIDVQGDDRASGWVVEFYHNGEKVDGLTAWFDSDEDALNYAVEVADGGFRAAGRRFYSKKRSASVWYNHETGEIFDTREEAMADAAELFDFGDPTNYLTYLGFPNDELPYIEVEEGQMNALLNAFGKKRIRKDDCIMANRRTAGLNDWEDYGDGSYMLLDFFGHEFEAYSPDWSYNDSGKWVLDVSWGNEDLSDWGEGGEPHTIGEFDTFDEMEDYMYSEWYNEDKWAGRLSYSRRPGKRARRTRRRASFFDPTDMASELMDIDNEIWDENGWVSGSQVDWGVYPSLVEQKMRERGIDARDIEEQDLEDLTDSNFHSLRRAIEGAAMTASRMSRWSRISRNAARKCTAVRRVVASKAYEIAMDIINSIESDGPFASEDDVQEYIDSCLDGQLIYYDDMWEAIHDYVSPSDIFVEFEVFEQLYDDVMREIGDLSEYVLEWTEWEDEGWVDEGGYQGGHDFTTADSEKEYLAEVDTDDGSITLTVTYDDSGESDERTFDDFAGMNEYVQSVWV